MTFPWLAVGVPKDRDTHTYWSVGEMAAINGFLLNMKRKDGQPPWFRILINSKLTSYFGVIHRLTDRPHSVKYLPRGISDCTMEKTYLPWRRNIHIQLSLYLKQISINVSYLVKKLRAFIFCIFYDFKPFFNFPDGYLWTPDLLNLAQKYYSGRMSVFNLGDWLQASTHLENIANFHFNFRKVNVMFYILRSQQCWVENRSW
jgi:hypothetical protein